MGISWRYGFSSVIGTSHLKAGMPCQDASNCNIFETSDGESILIAVASDGAGSASRAEIGSTLVCSSVMEFFGDLVRRSHSYMLTKDTLYSAIDEWFLVMRNAISICATSEGNTIRDYASTVVCAIVGSAWAVFFQIGDGAIVVADSEGNEKEQHKYSWVFWPQKGEYENTTYFVTSEEAIQLIQKDYAKRIIRELALFTDGLQGLVLHYQTQTVHDSFFRPIFEHLRSGLEELDINKSLNQFLGWEKVNSRTDDDKTLILAFRRSSENGKLENDSCIRQSR